VFLAVRHGSRLTLTPATPRFTDHYDNIEPGHAGYVHDAILADAARREPDA